MVKQIASPTIWVGLPCYNEAENLPGLIESLLSQSYSNLVIEFFDNASTDNSVEVIKSFQRLDSRLRLRCFDVHVNRVIQGQRLRYAQRSAEFISFRSCNDRLDRNFYRETLRLLQESEDIGLAYSHGKLHDLSTGQTVSASHSTRIDTSGLSVVESAAQVISRYVHPFALWGLYRRRVWEKLQHIECYGADHAFVCEASMYGGVKSTEEALETRTTDSSESAIESISRMWHTHHKMVERGLQIEDPYMTIDIRTPFTSMIRGHFEMIAGSFIPPVAKASVQRLALDILRERFSNFIFVEHSNLLNILDATNLEPILKFNQLASQDIFSTLSLIKRVSPNFSDRCNRLMRLLIE
jgi:hypothetical protein